MSYLASQLNMSIKDGVEFILKNFKLWDAFIEKWYVKELSFQLNADWGTLILLNEFLNERKELKHITKYGVFNICTYNRTVVFKIEVKNLKQASKNIKLDFLDLQENLDFMEIKDEDFVGAD